eukprot:gene14300-61110_t
MRRVFPPPPPATAVAVRAAAASGSPLPPAAGAAAPRPRGRVASAFSPSQPAERCAGAAAAGAGDRESWTREEEAESTRPTSPCTASGSGVCQQKPSNGVDSARERERSPNSSSARSDTPSRFVALRVRDNDESHAPSLPERDHVDARLDAVPTATGVGVSGMPKPSSAADDSRRGGGDGGGARAPDAGTHTAA